jgi:hypothetical protein
MSEYSDENDKRFKEAQRQYDNQLPDEWWEDDDEREDNLDLEDDDPDDADDEEDKA